MKKREYVLFEKPIYVNKPLDLSVAISTAPYSCEGLLDDEIETKDKSVVVHHCSDVALLFHQQKFQKLNTFTLDTMVTNLKRDVSSLKNYPDSAILDGIKSRYIQSVSDVKNYERYIRQHLDDFVKDLDYKQKIKDYEKKMSEDEKKKSDDEK